MSDHLPMALAMLTDLRTAAERAAANPKDQYLRQQLFQTAERAKKVERHLTRFATQEPEVASR